MDGLHCEKGRKFRLCAAITYIFNRYQIIGRIAQFGFNVRCKLRRLDGENWMYVQLVIESYLLNIPFIVTKEKLQKYISLFSKKYTSGTVARDDFIKDVQKAVYRGSEGFWREMYITLFGNITSPPGGSTRMSPRHAYSDKICLREFLIGMSRVKHATPTQKLICESTTMTRQYYEC